MSDPILVGVDAQEPDAGARPARDPVDALIALSQGVDLVVCGSRGYGPPRAVCLGGVTHRPMRAAHCPVMILPRGTEQQLERLAERQNAITT